ncbi:MAG: hypothetical protein R3B95_02835 [Nitrospirales bacterium]|nr:hypothetical protein [Nitrospirales bacterium]
MVAAKHFFVGILACRQGRGSWMRYLYDIYTGTLVDKLVATLETLGCTVIILSATLIGKRRANSFQHGRFKKKETKLPYPLITGRREGRTLKPIPITPPKLEPSKSISSLLEMQ